jgi:hypothetical protein
VRFTCNSKHYTKLTYRECRKRLNAQLKLLGVTLKEFRTWDCCERNRTLAGWYAGVMLEILDGKYTKPTP